MRKSEGRGGNSNKPGGGGDNDKADKVKIQMRYQAVVAKATKKLVTSSIEAERAEYAAADLSLEAAIKRRGDSTVKVSATLAIEDKYAIAEKEF